MCMGKLWADYDVKPDALQDIVVTFHDAIYTRNPLPTHLFVHECVHFMRQGAGEDVENAKAWCIKYVEDPEFRYAEELLAYREQYQYMIKHMRKSDAFDNAKVLAADLSGPMYGRLVTYHKALSDIIR